MLYHNHDLGLDREHRAQIRREVERNHLVTARAGLVKAHSRKGLATRGAAVVAALFK